MTFGRKPFRPNDVWSNATFGRYDVLPTTTFGRLRQMVENSSKFGRRLIRKEKIKNVYIYDPHISNIFSRQYQYLYICLSCTESSYMPLLGPPIDSEKRRFIHFE